MDEKSGFIVTITARGGSKGIVKKALLEVAGKTLINRSIDQALSSGLVSKVFISSDDQDILDVAKAYGNAVDCIRRPGILCMDTSPKYDSFRFNAKYLEENEPEFNGIYIDFDCTCPLRNVKLIDDFLGSAKKLSPSAGTLTVAKAHKHPEFNVLRQQDDGCLKPYNQNPVVARQQLTTLVVDHVASMYAFDTEYFKSYNALLDGPVLPFFVPFEYSLDIDELADVPLVEMLIETIEVV